MTKVLIPNLNGIQVMLNQKQNSSKLVVLLVFLSKMTSSFILVAQIAEEKYQRSLKVSDVITAINHLFNQIQHI
jgi:hypothetical protein